MNSVMNSGHKFSKVPSANIPRSSFDRSHGCKTTFDAGYLVPVYVDEALPGDTFNMKMTAFARLATPGKPVMDNMYLDSFFFAVPIRLIWSNWEHFNGAADDPADIGTEYTVPTMTGPSGDGILSNTLSDYFGLPVGQASITFNSLWHRGYNLVWNEWFRDQNLQDSVTVDKGDGPDTYSNYVLLRRGKRHDYFTSCLPWPQKGDAIEVPLGDTAPIVATGVNVRFTGGGNNGNTMYTINGVGTIGSLSAASSDTAITWANTGTDSVYESLEVDLSEAEAPDINELRQAFQMQKMLERDARGGTRYTEILRAHFGVVSPDARLQRPEYLGGGSSPVHVHPVPQTSEEGSTPQGNLAAYGTVVASDHGFVKSFTEHCILIGLVSVRADLTYQQGMNRMFSRQTRYDFYWPALACIGEQSVLNKEIYCDGSANDDNVFGYQERYAEYRYKPSQITGLFRSNVGAGSASIDVWHLSEDFSSLPSLDDTFIQSDPPIDRVIATEGEPHFLFDGFFKLICARPMPVYGVPGLIDHF